MPGNFKHRNLLITAFKVFKEFIISSLYLVENEK
jgi:hypothetical protein